MSMRKKKFCEKCKSHLFSNFVLNHVSNSIVEHGDTHTFMQKELIPSKTDLL